MKKYKSPEEVGITIMEATMDDVPSVENFLGRPDIDSLFVPALSGPARGMTIKERVERKIKNGKWVIAIRDKEVVGCMAIVPAKLTQEIEPPKREDYISKGISIQDWSKKEIWELSTVVVDLKLTKREEIKGIGKTLFEMAKNWVRAKGPEAGFITDSWVGGDMGGFINAMNKKEYQLRHEAEKINTPNTLFRIYSDPAKRGEDGPATVIYGIPLDEEDWHFFESKQKEISELQKEYEDLEHLK